MGRPTLASSSLVKTDHIGFISAFKILVFSSIKWVFLFFFLCLVEGLIKKWWLLESTPRVPQIQGSLSRFPETGTPYPQAISFYLTKVG